MQASFARVCCVLAAALQMSLFGQAAAISTFVRSEKAHVLQRNAMTGKVIRYGEEPPEEEKPTMTPIEAMRAGLCWHRPHLIDHGKCMQWMVGRCKVKSTNFGWCDKLKDYTVKNCKDGHEDACEYAKQLGFEVKPDPPKKEEEKTLVDKIKDMIPNPLEEIEDEAGEEEKKEMEEAAMAPAPAPVIVIAPPAPAPAPEMPPGLTSTTTTTEVLATTTTEAPTTTTAAPTEAPAEAPAPPPPPPPPPPKEDAPPEKKDALTAPSQGYSGKPVRHEDGDTYTGDWQTEYGSEVGKKMKKSGAEGCRVGSLLALALLSWSVQMAASEI